MTANAIGVLISAPSPLIRTIGNSPNMVVKVVMRIGLNLTLEDMRMASPTGMPLIMS